MPNADAESTFDGCSLSDVYLRVSISPLSVGGDWWVLWMPACPCVMILGVFIIAPPYELGDSLHSGEHNFKSRCANQISKQWLWIVLLGENLAQHQALEQCIILYTYLPIDMHSMWMRGGLGLQDAGAVAIAHSANVWWCSVSGNFVSCNMLKTLFIKFILYTCIYFLNLLLLLFV